MEGEGVCIQVESNTAEGSMEVEGADSLVVLATGLARLAPCSIQKAVDLMGLQEVVQEEAEEP